MSVTGIRNSNMTYYQGSVSRTAEQQECFTVEKPDEIMEAGRRENGEVPDRFAGMSFEQLMSSGMGRNRIPVVNQIVSSRNPEDGEIYRVYFTDERITCNHGDGRRAWEIEIEDAQQTQKVKEYFEQYQPDRDWVREYYSGDKMSMAVKQRFWSDLFEKR